MPVALKNSENDAVRIEELRILPASRPSRAAAASVQLRSWSYPPSHPPSSSLSSLSSSSSNIALAPVFLCACCGEVKPVPKTRRVIWSDTVAVAACVHKGFVKRLEFPFPQSACKHCYDIAKQATDLCRWSFPTESAFKGEHDNRKPVSHEAQVCSSTHLLSYFISITERQPHSIYCVLYFSNQFVPVCDRRRFKHPLHCPPRHVGPKHHRR